MKLLLTGCCGALSISQADEIMDLLEQLGGVRIRFASQPSALQADLRPVWRLTILLLILHKCCRNHRSSLQKLHVLNWAIRQPDARRTLLGVLDGEEHPDVAIVRFDPALNRALDLARAEMLIESVGDGKFQITAKGQALAEAVLSDPDCMRDEKQFLVEIGNRLTETRVTKLLQTLA